MMVAPDPLVVVCDIDANCPGWLDWFYGPDVRYGECPNCRRDRSEHPARLDFP